MSRGKGIHSLGIGVMWLGMIVLIGTMMGYFSGMLFVFIFLFGGYMIVRHGCSVMMEELESDPETRKVFKLLEDERYEAAQKIVVEESRNNTDPEQVIERAVLFLEEKGIPGDEAKANLYLINRVLIEQRDKLEILRVENL